MSSGRQATDFVNIQVKLRKTLETRNPEHESWSMIGNGRLLSLDLYDCEAISIFVNVLPSGSYTSLLANLGPGLEPLDLQQLNPKEDVLLEAGGETFLAHR